MVLLIPRLLKLLKLLAGFRSLTLVLEACKLLSSLSDATGSRLSTGVLLIERKVRFISSLNGLKSVIFVPSRLRDLRFGKMLISGGIRSRPVASVNQRSR